jgi:hypothetical protein
MVGRNVFRCCLVGVALFGARSATAEPITFTGSVASDFNQATNPGVVVITNNVDQNDPIHIAQPTWMTDAGLVSGMNIKEVALNYNAAVDTMYVGVETWGVAGYVPTQPGSGPTSSTNFGGDNAMVVGFAPLTGTYNPANLTPPVFVAGISGDKPAQSGSGLDGFNVATYAGGRVPGTMNLLTGFGQTLTAGMGNLAFNPRAATPGFEFTITNFSKLLGANPANGLVVMTQDGQVNANSGKDELVGTFPEAQSIGPHTPEPTTWMIWAGLAGGMAWSVHRRSRRSPS